MECDYVVMATDLPEHEYFPLDVCPLDTPSWAVPSTFLDELGSKLDPSHSMHTPAHYSKLATEINIIYIEMLE